MLMWSNKSVVTIYATFQLLDIYINIDDDETLKYLEFPNFPEAP